MKEASLEGCILGTAVGDALGLPYEGMSSGRARKLLGTPDRFRFLLGKGMVSDDTEHTCIVAQSLIVSGGDAEGFLKALSVRFRRWFVLLPAGVGMATARACIRLLLGYSAKTSGLWSAGNGPAMRSAILGAYFDHWSEIQEFVRLNTRITHTDPKAEMGALAIAIAARLAREDRQIEADEYVAQVIDLIAGQLESVELIPLLEKVSESIHRGESTAALAQSLNLGQRVGGYVYHCVPVVLHCWLSHQTDFRNALITIIECGGDTDTNAAMVGGIVGARVGREGIPVDWLDGIWEWPMTVERMKTLAAQLADTKISGKSIRPTSTSALAILPRNLLFLMVVLFHGFRRLLPPY
ncbi:dinitrogenase reductase [Blastopirellula marina]|uniref:Dinitrogenase reductase n=1 Tax=Blastopirellula marina TaxID=124 RepID=A0A2S8GLC7_9BACT|nr:dinitrogenase reductase [Blastopirellula marina]